MSLPPSKELGAVPFHIAFDGVLILDCTGRNDMQTARHLHDDLLHICRVQTIVVPSRSALFRELRRVANQCALDGRRPILHIDAHGSPEAGLKVGSDLVGWKELGERLARINSTCAGGLGVVMASCYGIFGLDALDIEWPSPFAFLVAAHQVVEQGDICDVMGRFYRTLMNTKRLADSEAELAGKFVVMRPALFFYSVFRRVYQLQSVGRGGRDHVEALVSRAVNEGIVTTPEDLRRVRKAIRFNNRFPEKTYLRVGKRFMNGQPLVPFQEFIAAIEAVQ